MHARSALIADGQSPKAMQPGEGAFDDPAGAAQRAAVRAPTLGELRGDAALRELVPMRLRIVATVALYESGFPHGPAGTPAQGRHRVHQRQQLGDVMPVRGGQRRDERNPVRVGKNMMFRPGLAAIGRVRSSFFPPRTARRDALSTTARARSSWPRRRNSSSRTVWSRFQTPARCHRTSRRQQVVPDPQPIPGGSMFHGMPLRSTNRMPVSTARSGIGFRPAYRRLRRRRFGSSGSIRLHKSSSINASVMPDRLTVGQAKVPSRRSKYKRVVS